MINTYQDHNICQNCGAEVHKSANFCGKCGKPLNTIPENNNGTVEKYLYYFPNIDLISNNSYKNAIKNMPEGGIVVPLGVDKNNNWIFYDLTKAPNLLIGGTVMSGKTNMVNSILLCLISKYTIEDLRIIIADSKGVDYMIYNNIPHLLIPVIKDNKHLELVLQSEITEMKERYKLLSDNGLKGISDYNEKISKIPYHFIFIDDYTTFANNKKDYSDEIEMLAQNGWTVGIHLILVVNHPTANVLTTISRFNFPTRISFRVPSVKDSRTVLEVPGAEKIYGIGNALVNSPFFSKIEGIHLDLIEDKDIEEIIKDLESKNESLLLAIKRQNIQLTKSIDEPSYIDDPLYKEVVQFALETGKISASLIQRRFRIRYNRAARIVDLLEEKGIIGPANGSKPREVLIQKKTT